MGGVYVRCVGEEGIMETEPGYCKCVCVGGRLDCFMPTTHTHLYISLRTLQIPACV